MCAILTYEGDDISEQEFTQLLSMHEFRRNHILPLRKDLAQFHKRRSKLHESHAQTFRHAVLGGDFRRLILFPRHEQSLQRLRHTFTQGNRVETVLEKHAQDVAETAQPPIRPR